MAGHPEAVFGFEVIGEDGGEVGLHRLVLLNRESKDDEKEADGDGDDGEQGENLEEAGGEDDAAKNNHKVDELPKSKRAEQFIVGFDVLGDLIICHSSILS